MPAQCVDRNQIVCPLLLSLAALTVLAHPTSAQERSLPATGGESRALASVTGDLTIIYADDFANRRSELLHLIRDDPSGKTFRIRFEGNVPRDLRSGMRVTARGVTRDAELFVAAADGAGLVITQTAPTSTASTATTGEQKTLVMVANFRDAAVTCSATEIATTMFENPGAVSVSSLYNDTSHGRLSFTGTVVGPYSVPFSTTGPCDLGALADGADQHAMADGVNLSDYARRVYVMPPNGCPGAGFGSTGGSPSTTWIFACNIPGVYAHEIGHNLGMDHAATASSEYGDGTDPLGYSSMPLRPLNAPHRQQMGWLDPSRTQIVESSGAFSVAPLSQDPATAIHPQTLIVRKPDTNEFYYVSYRTRLGLDRAIDGLFYDRVSVHRYKGDGSASRTWLLASLTDGERFVDEQNGFAITVTSHDTDGATVQVDISRTCSPAVPAMTMTPSNQSGLAGSPRAYSVSLTNRDTAECPVTTFTLAGSVPSGWSAAFDSPTLVVSPGATGVATFTVTSLLTSTPGTYSVAAFANGAASTQTATQSATYTVEQPPCVTASPNLIGAPLEQSGAAGSSVAFQLTLTNLDGATCGSRTFSLVTIAPAGWSSIVSPSSIAVAPGRTATVTLSVTSSSGAAAGTYNINTAALVAAQPVAALGVAYTVVVPTPLPTPPPPELPADTVAPTAPGLPTAKVSQKLKQIQLTWSASSDNIGVAGYRVFRNGVLVVLCAGASWTDTSLMTGTSQTYMVVAYDAAGNLSAPSGSVMVTLSGGRKGR